MAERAYEDGATIRGMVLDWNPETGAWAPAVICLLNDEPILRRDWDRPVGPSDAVAFVELPMSGGGGGSNPLQLLLNVALVALAIWTGGATTGLLGLTAGTAAMGGTFLGNLVFGLTAGLVMALGGMLIGAIFKGPSVPSGLLAAQTAEAASPTYSVNASNNQQRLYQPVGEGFGRIQVVPDRVAQAHARYSANEMYLCQVFGLGRGEYHVESMSFGDTVFWLDGQLVSGYDVEVELLGPGEPVTLFPDNVEGSLEVSGQQLLPTNSPEFVGPLGPYSCNPPGTRTDHVVINVTMPQGLGWYNDQGGLNAIAVGLRVEFRRLDDDGAPIGGWQVAAEPSWAMATTTPQRFSVDVRPVYGRWECRLARTDAQGLDGRTLNSVYWESMYAIMPGSLTYNQSTVALRTKATNVLSQSAASSFKVVQTRILPEWSPATRTWGAPVPTRRFAAAVSSVLRSSWGGNLPDNRIDLDALWGTVQPILDGKDWTFDGYFDGAYKVWTLVMEMCQAFRVVPRVTAGGVGFVYDRPGRPPRHVFTPTNICRGSLSVVYNTFTEDTPDNVIWSYLDQDAGFQQREVNCRLPDSRTENPVIKSFIGVVKRKQAFEMGVFAIACNRHRRIEVKFRTEGAGRLMSMGDVCLLSHPHFHDVRLGRVRGWDAARLEIDLGDGVPDGTGLHLVLRDPTGAPWGPCLLASLEGGVARLDPEDYELLQRQGMADAFGFMRDGSDGLATDWILQEGRPFEGRLIVQSVVPSDAWRYEVTAINDSDQVDDYGDLPVPPWSYRGDGTQDPVEPTEAPSEFTYELGWLDEDEPWTWPPVTWPPVLPPIFNDPGSPVIILGWLPVAWAYSYEVEYVVDGAESWTPLGSFNVNSGVHIVTIRGIVTVRVRGVGSTGIPGPWGEVDIDTNASATGLVNLNVDSFTDGNLVLSWSHDLDTAYDANPRYDIHQYELRLADGAGAQRRVATLGAGESSYTYTRAMAVADGVVVRRIIAGVRMHVTRTSTSGGFLSGGGRKTSTSTYWTPWRYFTAEDPAPVLTEEPTLQIGPTSITLTAAPVDVDYTGYVIARGNGPEFQLADLAETRIAASLPFEWTGLAPASVYWFRLAAKDPLADLTGRYLDLAWSDAISVTTTGG